MFRSKILIRLLLPALMCLTQANTVFAADFLVSCKGFIEEASRGCSILMQGQINRGNASRLLEAIREPLPEGWHYDTLVLDSLGGNVEEALLLAKVVRDGMLKTSTSSAHSLVLGTKPDPRYRLNHACVSACFLVWVAGIERFAMSQVEKDGRRVGIGLHRPYFFPLLYNDSPSKVAERQQTMTAAIRDYLRREQVPEDFIGKMLERSSREVYWLSESGDTWSLNGTAAWFEEMMIARCGYDPEKARYGDRLLERRAFGPEMERYIEWRQKYNACEYQIRENAQRAMQSSK